MKKSDILNFIFKSILAGLLIAIAGWIFLISSSITTEFWGKVLGAFLFSLGLIGVILLEANLFTGKIGYVNSKQKAVEAVFILFLNLVTAFAVGSIYKAVVGVSTSMDSRLAKEWYRVLFDGIGCGVCIYFAVECYKKTKSLFPVLLGVMAFILAGFEHCIADAFYFGASALTWKGLGYIGLSIVGNSIGSLLIRFLQIGITKKE